MSVEYVEQQKDSYLEPQHSCSNGIVSEGSRTNNARTECDRACGNTVIATRRYGCNSDIRLTVVSRSHRHD